MNHEVFHAHDHGTRLNNISDTIGPEGNKIFGVGTLVYLNGPECYEINLAFSDYVSKYAATNAQEDVAETGRYLLNTLLTGYARSETYRDSGKNFFDLSFVERRDYLKALGLTRRLQDKVNTIINIVYGK